MILDHMMHIKLLRHASGSISVTMITVCSSVLVAISDLNQTASLDQTLSAPLHYVAMVCKCYLLLNKVTIKSFTAISYGSHDIT